MIIACLLIAELTRTFKNVNILANGRFELGFNVFNDEIFGPFKQRVFGAGKESGQVTKNSLTFAAR